MTEEFDVEVLEPSNYGIEIYSMQFRWDEFRRKDVHHDLIYSVDLIIRALFDHRTFVYLEIGTTVLLCNDG